MPNLNKDALDIWNALRPMIDKEIERRTRGTVQRRKAKVTTAPSLVTNKIGVTEPFGDQYFIPFNTNLSTAKVGDVVWVEFMYGATNAFASMYATADTKDVTVGGVLDVVQRRCSATLSSAGWYRLMKYEAENASDVIGLTAFVVDFSLLRRYANNPNEAHKISLFANYNSIEFLNEVSKSLSVGIDKIRYTYNGTNGYVDIHYSLSASNFVSCDFTVHAPMYQSRFTVESLQSVADAPSGETILATHNFQSNNALWQSATITPTLYNLAGSITLNGNSIWYKSDKSVLQFSTIANINITSRTGGNGGFKFNLPFEYNGPTKDMYVGTQSKFSNEFVYIHLTNGSSEVIVRTTETHSNITTGAVRYLISQVTLFMN